MRLRPLAVAGVLRYWQGKMITIAWLSVYQGCRIGPSRSYENLKKPFRGSVRPCIFRTDSSADYVI